MAVDDLGPVRVADRDDSNEIAQLLVDFNREFDTPTPEPSVLADRLRRLLAEPSTFALLAGEPAVGVALVTLRPNVWFDGRVALLDELYVRPDRRGGGIGAAIIELLVDECRTRGVELIEINVDEGDVDAQRFYRRHGFLPHEPDGDERAFYWWQELGGG